MKFMCLPSYEHVEKGDCICVLPVAKGQFLCDETESLPRLVHDVLPSCSDMTKGSVREVFTPQGFFLLVDVGYDVQQKEYAHNEVRKAYASVARMCHSRGWSRLAVFPPSLGVSKPIGAMTEGLIFPNYAFNRYKSKKKAPFSLIEEIVWIGGESEHCIPWAQKSLVLLDAMNLTRDLVNENANVVNSSYLVKVAKEFQQENVRVTVWGKEEIEEHNMGLLLAVNAGSAYPPALIMIEYNPHLEEPHCLFVGKGVTFDSGGLNLKPTNFIEDMRSDMGGAATLLGAMKAWIDLGIKKRVSVAIPVTDNAIGNRSMSPGDVYRSSKGVSVEIANTDAEGRLILADAMEITIERLKPDFVVDIATLTGAAAVAVGEHCVAMFANEKAQSRAQSLQDLSVILDEPVWPMPLMQEYNEQLKSERADVKNCGGRYGGAITAALFLERFVSDLPWIHLDIAGPSYLKQGRGCHPKEATGFGVALLARWIESEF